MIRTKKQILLVAISFLYSFSMDLELDYSSKVEQKLLIEWQKNGTMSVDTVMAFLISDGVTDSVKIELFKQQLIGHFFKLKARIKKNDGIIDKAEEIFDYLHKNILKNADENAKLIEIFNTGRYNNISANAIYYVLCQKYELPVEILSSAYYINLRLLEENRKINIDIMDKKKGFDKKIEKEDLVQILILLNVIEADDIDDVDINQVYSEYFDDYKEIHPYLLCAAFYNLNGILWAQKGNLLESLKCLEKAVLINPNNDDFIDFYKSVLYNNSNLVSPPDKFLPHLKNALFFLKNDPSFTDNGIIMVNKIIGYLVDDQHEYDKALDIIMELKTSYPDSRFIKRLAEFEADIEYFKILALLKRGDYESAYKSMKILFYQNPDLPKYKDAYIDTGIKYANQFVFRTRDYDKAFQIMDSIYTVASDYSIVADFYMYLVMANLSEKEMTNVKDSKSAYNLAHKAHRLFPDHPVTKQALSKVYHE
ncbi:MAG: hypothetical protein JXB44_12990, partial [Calditrichaceae bacterium]